METCIEITGYEGTSEDFLRDGGASIVFDEVDVEGSSVELIDCTVGHLMPTWVAFLLSSGAEADGDEYYEYNGLALFVAMSGDDDEESETVTIIIADLTAPPTLMAEDFPLHEGSAEEAEASEDESDATAFDPTPTAAAETATTTAAGSSKYLIALTAGLASARCAGATAHATSSWNEYDKGDASTTVC